MFGKVQKSNAKGVTVVPTRNVNLTEHYHEFVEAQVSSGRFKNASEVMRAGLRLLETETAVETTKLDILRRLAAEGFEELDQGQGTELNNIEELSNFISQIGQRARKQASD